MCEWLSHGEWCDVKLLCGGRSFNAHRAVLASVSTFLRRVLLACPVDETPTFIVLPDFDLEALSSVLYYIYNGEVILQKHKLGLFLDIIQAMKIYIDCQYLPKVKEDTENELENILNNFEFNSCFDANALKTEIFTLGCGDDNDQSYINIKRGAENQSVLLQYSQSEADFHDKVVRCQNESELCRSRLGNFTLPCGDRQRNSFLRDLFIETYPRNGNVNGLTESVLAISNEYYRPPASVLSTNVNVENLDNNHSLAEFCTKTKQQTLNMSAIIHSGQQLQCGNNYNGKSKPNARVSMNLPCIKYPTGSNDLTFIYGKSETVAEFADDRISFLPQQLLEKNTLSNIKCHLFKDPRSYVAPNFTVKKYGIEIKSKDFKPHNTPKVIFNQVLENPWSPRKPNNFRPLQRKRENPNLENSRVEKIGVVNDSNNNQTPAMVAAENLTDRVSLVRELSEASSPVSISAGHDCFKCTHCNQVFTSNESLAVHMRRHSTNARYTCGECGKTFSQLRNFKYHMSIHRGTREFAATCSVCGKYFNDRGYLSSHMKIHRNRKEYKCTLCPKSFNQRVAYNMHVRIHTGVKPHVCEECGKAFSRKMLLKQHQRTHSGERPYACPHCDKRFADRSNMTLHLRLHTGVKPFSCSLCPKSFTKKHHLKSHLNFHTGSKPYSCPRCKLAFTQSSNMRTHYKKCSAPDLGDSTLDPASANSQNNL